MTTTQMQSGLPQSTDALPAPVTAARRIDSLDVLRGFAVLGILIMNIQSFGLPMAAYFNPTVAGDFTGPNYWVWVVGHLLADLKFMSIFSMLFGAGVVLFTSRIEEKGKSALGLQYRRLAWLLLIGMIHAYLLWVGDILVMYALCGMIVYWARKWRPGLLITLAVASLLITTALTASYGVYLTSIQEALDEHDQNAVALVEPAESADQAVLEPSARNEEEPLIMGTTVSEVRRQLQEMHDNYDPPQDQLDQEVAAMTGSYIDEIAYRAPTVVIMQVFVTLFYGWRVISMMLLGMALFKWGVLSAACSKSCYLAMAELGFGIGLPIVWLGFQSNITADFELIAAKYTYSHYNYFGSVFVAIGWIGVIMLLCRSGVMRWLTTSLGAVGTMAFTNYLMHTIICTTIFNGRSGLGLGLFNEFDRVQLLVVVGAVFVLQMIYSPIWLHYFRFGPFEWLWRSLTYWQRQPMLRK